MSDNYLSEAELRERCRIEREHIVQKYDVVNSLIFINVSLLLYNSNYLYLIFRVVWKGQRLMIGRIPNLKSISNKTDMDFCGKPSCFGSPVT